MLQTCYKSRELINILDLQSAGGGRRYTLQLSPPHKPTFRGAGIAVALLLIKLLCDMCRRSDFFLARTIHISFGVIN